MNTRPRPRLWPRPIVKYCLPLMLLVALLVAPVPSRAAGEFECNLDGLRDLQGDLDRLPKLAVREAIFYCAEIQVAVHQLDHLDKDLLFGRAKNHSLEAYGAKQTETNPPISYLDLLGPEQLARLWRLVRSFYGEPDPGCYAEKLDAVLDMPYMFRFTERPEFDQQSRQLVIGASRIAVDEINGNRSEITLSHDPIRQGDCPTTFCDYEYQITLYNGQDNEPAHRLMLTMVIGVGKVNRGLIALEAAQQALENLFIHWPAQCFPPRP